jgi:hypothetical protein
MASQVLPIPRWRIQDQGRTTMCKLISALAAASLGAAAWIDSIGYWWPNEDHPICAWMLNGTAWIWTCGV